MESFVDLKMRLAILSAVTVAVASVLYFADYIAVQIFITILLAVIGVAALREYVNLLKEKGVQLPFLLLAILSVAYIGASYLGTLKEGYLVSINCVVALFFFSVFFYHFYRIEGAIVSIASCFFGALYIIIPLGLLLKILYPSVMNPSLHDGRLWLTYLIAVTKVTDMGGYFLGKLWGRTKLAPHISPGKTVVGAVAGFFSAIGLSLVFFLISHQFAPHSFSLSLGEAIILGGLMGIFAQLGDLAESLLKRDARIKDSSTLPGIGGVLDLIDSLLFTIPVLYLFLKTSGYWI